MISDFRDVADSSRASYWPEIATEIDKPEDILAELLGNALSRWNGNLPATMMEFRATVAAVAIQAIRDAAGDPGALTDLFGDMEPKRGDLETSKLIVSEIVQDSNPELQAECVDFVFGFGAGDCRNETEIGEKFGVGKSCVSQRCVALRKLFNLPEVHGMKSDKARANYAERQKGKRQRPPATPWAWAGLLKGAISAI